MVTQKCASHKHPFFDLASTLLSVSCVFPSPHIFFIAFFINIKIENKLGYCPKKIVYACSSS